jgi:hypothetical protein
MSIWLRDRLNHGLATDDAGKLAPADASTMSFYSVEGKRVWDPEKWKPVFRKDCATGDLERESIQSEAIVL